MAAFRNLMRQPVRRRRPWLWAASGLPLAALALACAPARPAEPVPVIAPPAREPQRGGTLVYSGNYGVETLHPFKVGTTAPLQRTLGLIYESLLNYRVEPGLDHRIDYEVVPALAERWEQPNDTTYLLHVRPGVKWHDGQPFTADDVLFTYEWVNKEKYAIRSTYSALKSLEKVEGATLRAELKAPSAFFLEDMASQVAYIAPKHAVERGDDLSKVAIGTGPFKLKSFDRTKETVYQRNADYWQPGKPYLEGIRTLWGLDRSAELATFVAAQTDLLSLLDRAQLDTLIKTRPEAQYDVRPADNGVSLVMKLDQRPFDDIRVRRALHLVTDRQAMVNTLTRGDGTINPPGVPGWKTGWAISQEELLKLPGYRQPKDPDVAEAKRLLAEAGYPNGFKFTIPQSKDAPVPLPISEIMQAQLRAIGVEMGIAVQDGASFTKREKEGDFDAVVWVNFKARPGDRLADRHHSKGVLNTIGQNDPKLDELLDAVPSTVDVQKRKQVVQELQRYLLDKLYFVPTIEMVLYELRQPWVQGFRGMGDVIMTTDHANAPSVWLDREKMPVERR